MFSRNVTWVFYGGELATLALNIKLQGAGERGREVSGLCTNNYVIDATESKKLVAQPQARSPPEQLVHIQADCQICELRPRMVACAFCTFVERSNDILELRDTVIEYLGIGPAGGNGNLQTHVTHMTESIFAIWGADVRRSSAVWYLRNVEPEHIPVVKNVPYFACDGGVYQHQ